MCPNCNKNSLCGCKSCKSRNKGKIKGLRTQKFVNDPEGDSLIKCPYCRVKLHLDVWLDHEWKLKQEMYKDEEV